ncbi:MAG TPA: cobalamin-dependent protein [Prolixibacteraceae bacterium]|nr:cobalamin-dependent protein [Prolixibacteraceae bacterium]
MSKYELHSKNLERALILLDKQAAELVLNEALRFGPPIEVVGELVSLALNRIGEDWENGKLALSQVYMSGVICEELIDKVMPPQSPVRKSQPKMAIGVFEDYHMLGKRIIYSSLRASGFELTDLGGGLSIDKLVAFVQRDNIKILLLSVLMLPSALHVKDLKQKLNGSNVKIVVGGAPFRFDDQLWKEVGVDACGATVADAVNIVNKMMEEL